ncbi:hypothetical protein DYB25_000763 [Aphanomyces astaci]|uniref:Protein kinase domain-containing protein n=1 Tax=Aphanomyces astaci TaxID=112090 RepID=A0A397ATN1_APHAT|nr:hypothetical protein DYB25_000763 [Aphanomyces astaci]RHY52494.1 hypothetical protein DYB34_001296 [Aphanomyces astaci]
MGQVTSWCLGDDEHDHVLTSLKEDRASTRTAASSGASQATGSDQNEQTAIYRSRPKAIMSSGPMYAAGTFENKYALKSVIGNGSTSICHLCEEKATKKHFACKVIDKRAIQSKSDDLLDQFQVEIQVLQSLDHPNIIHMEDVYQTDTRICMVTELMEGGELFDYVVQKGTLSEVEASCLVRKITSAIAYMHACGVVHRDLKPVDSEKRYTAEQACLHPWVTGQRTPNQFLESPNYLKSIKQRHQAVVADAVAAANQSPATDTTLLPGLHSRRLSH